MNNQDTIYTTEELIEILKKEQEACIKGQRTFPMPDNAEEIAKEYAIGKIVGAQGLFEIAVYHEFREQVQKYQIENGISGLETNSYLIGDKTYRFPIPVDQLELTSDDYHVLRLAKESIVEAFLEWCDDSTYLSVSVELKDWDCHVETTKEYIMYFSSCCDWAEICGKDDIELSLMIGYGDYHKAPYLHDKHSDCCYFYANKACHVLP